MSAQQSIHKPSKSWKNPQHVVNREHEKLSRSRDKSSARSEASQNDFDRRQHRTEHHDEVNANFQSDFTRYPQEQDMRRTPIPAPQYTHTQSRSWKNPQYEVNRQLEKLNTNRNKFCPRSEAWSKDFDLNQHRKEQYDASKAKWQSDFMHHLQEQETRRAQGLPRFSETQIRPAFDGRQFGNNFSAVLCQRTVFTLEYDVNRVSESEPYMMKEVAAWPSKAEQKYEGDERISTDPLHGRFLGAPRCLGNETVNWMQRKIIHQYYFDDFHRLPDANHAGEIIFRTHNIPGLEIDEHFEDIMEEGKPVERSPVALIDADLMKMLNA